MFSNNRSVYLIKNISLKSHESSKIQKYQELIIIIIIIITIIIFGLFLFLLDHIVHVQNYAFINRVKIVN